MSARIIGSLVRKDFTIFFRNRFFALVTVLGLVFYLIIYFIMPKSVNESLDIGLYSPAGLPPAFEQIEEEGLIIKAAASEEALKEAVIDGKYLGGIVLPADMAEKLRAGQKPTVRLYFAAGTPAEMRDIVGVIIEELVYRQLGQSLTVEVTGEVLGPDLAGAQIPPRDRLRPLFAIFLILTETMGLATLISEEVERRTIQALLVTPTTVADFFMAKGITGVSLAFLQAVLFMAIVGGMDRQPLIILAALLLGTVVTTGIGFIIGSLAKDMMSVLAWSLPTLIVLFVPATGVIFPGTVTDWVRVIPSYYLVEIVHRVSNFGAGWGEVWTSLLVLLGSGIMLVWLGILALRRKAYES